MKKSDGYYIPKGIVFLSGEPDSGKTTAALSVPGVRPDEIVFFNDDLKEPDLDIECYHNLSTELTLQSITKFPAIFEYVHRKVDDYKNKKAKVLVFDNFARMEIAIREYSMTIMRDISPLSPNQIANISQLTWPYTFQFYTSFLTEMLQVAPTVFITMHLREKMIGQKGTGQLEPRGQRPLIEKSVMRLFLRHGDLGGVPTALIMKRIVKLIQDKEDGHLIPVNVLPRKVSKFTWQRVNDYWQNPIGDRPPTIDEIPDEHELSIMDGILTEDQRYSLKLAYLAAEEEAISNSIASKEAVAESIKEQVQELLKQGMAIPAIAKELGVSIPEVSAALG